MIKTWLCWENSFALLLKLKADLKKTKSVIDFLLLVFFLAYYSIYSIINVERTLIHLIFGLFAIVEIGLLLFKIISFKNSNKKLKRDVPKIVRFAKYPFRFVILVINSIDLIYNGGTSLIKISLIVSIIVFVLQILFEIVINAISKYVDLFLEAVKMDYENSALIKATVNAYNKPKQKKDGIITSLIKDKVKSGIDNFIDDNNGDEINLEDISSDKKKLRNEINNYKKKYINSNDEKHHFVVESKKNGNSCFRFLKK